jgi:hypothetical protein
MERVKLAKVIALTVALVLLLVFGGTFILSGLGTMVCGANSCGLVSMCMGTGLVIIGSGMLLLFARLMLNAPWRAEHE